MPIGRSGNIWHGRIVPSWLTLSFRNTPPQEARKPIPGSPVSPWAIQDAISCVIPGGHIAQLGLPSDNITLDLNELIFKGIRFYGIVGRRIWETWEDMDRLLSSGDLDITPVLTHTMELEEFEEGMRLMEAGECGKVVLTVS